MADQPSSSACASPLYSNWLLELARRFNEKLSSIWTVHNFELGPEFELAICEVLRDVLPERAAVCRGYVEEQSGLRAGDDIIVYDAARFPTLRCLGRELWKKERVPAEAVLGYIEAKHTLYVGSHPTTTRGQSLAKALTQIADVKSLRRAPVPLSRISARMSAGQGISAPRRLGFPEVRNPWYGAIWAKEIVFSDHESSPEKIAGELFADDRLDRLRFPDVIASRNLFAAPVFEGASDEGGALRPFILAPDVSPLLATRIADSLGIAMAIIHLTWAIEELLLGDIPWAGMLHQVLERSGEELLVISRDEPDDGASQRSEKGIVT